VKNYSICLEIGRWNGDGFGRIFYGGFWVVWEGVDFKSGRRLWTSSGKFLRHAILNTIYTQYLVFEELDVDHILPNIRSKFLRHFSNFSPLCLGIFLSFSWSYFKITNYGISGFAGPLKSPISTPFSIEVLHNNRPILSPRNQTVNRTTPTKIYPKALQKSSK
jgi:hypothetical protein